MKKTAIGDYNYECKNSGLFKIDAFGIPQAIFRLTPDKKISKDKTWDNIPQEHVLKMNRELNQILCRYIHEDESSIEQPA
ncbi:MAG: hypothetical protein A2X96_07900 [Syntrophobacterales bacterium GWC2_56_13]|nr:MAG: hypothetical protein A2X96_07900 [Syntrophobacterales bacterium GWC2_56_13]